MDPYFQSRFRFDPSRDPVWKVIAAYLQQFVPTQATILDMGAGYCSFINNIQAAKKHALDRYEGLGQCAGPDVAVHVGDCAQLADFFPHDYFDAVFASNLLEHLNDEVLAATIDATKVVLKPNGRLILIQPNYRYAFKEYFDDYTHVRVFSHVSIRNFLTAHGFETLRLEPRFLPLSFSTPSPKWPWLVRLYLALPYRPLGKQMLVVTRTVK